MKRIKVTMALLLLSSVFLFSTESKPFFQASQKQPYHLSVGAVLFDQNGRIACHHFNELFGQKDVYILMRESMVLQSFLSGIPFFTVTLSIHEKRRLVRRFFDKMRYDFYACVVSSAGCGLLLNTNRRLPT